MHALVLRTSILGDHSNSNRLLDDWLQARRPQQVTQRNLAAEPIPHLDGERFNALNAATANPVQALSEQLIGEIEAADEIVIGVPMYNFGVPSQLKSWMDHLARAGRTFQYTPEGPVGLLQDKPVTIMATRGGAYANTEHDNQAPFIRQFLQFIGLKNVRFVYAEALATDQREPALERAKAELAA